MFAGYRILDPLIYYFFNAFHYFNDVLYHHWSYCLQEETECHFYIHSSLTCLFFFFFLLTGCFIKILFLQLNFEQSNFDRSCHYPFVACVWVGYDFLDVWIYNFHQDWHIFGHYMFQYLFSFSFLSLRDSVYELGHIKQSQSSLKVFSFIQFFIFVFHFG